MASIDASYFPPATTLNVHESSTETTSKSRRSKFISLQYPADPSQASTVNYTMKLSYAIFYAVVVKEREREKKTFAELVDIVDSHEGRCADTPCNK